MSEYIDLLQWPAMVVTLFGAYWLASRDPRRRMFGFWMMVLSNLMWIVWGWSDEAWALIVLQVGLMALNARGIIKNEHEAQKE